MITEQQEVRAQELRRYLAALYKIDQFAIHDKVIEFHDRLKQKYTDYHQCRLYHLISGSTIALPVTRFDYLGADSIEAFILGEYTAVFGTLAPPEAKAA